MDGEQRLRVAGFIAGLDVAWFATVIDSEVMTAQEAINWRKDQFDKFLDAFVASDDGGTTHERYKDRWDPIAALLEDPRKVGLAAFVQFGILAPRHFYECVQGALYRYQHPRWQADWETVKVEFDRKDVKPEGGQRLIEEILYPILASAEMTLHLPNGYEVPDHPIARLRQESCGRGLNLLTFLGSLDFPDSAVTPAIQLADVAGWILRRRITHPEEPDAKSAFELLKLRLYRTGDPALPFHLFFRRGKALRFEDLPRYSHLLAC